MKSTFIILFVTLQTLANAKYYYNFTDSCRISYYNIIKGKLPVANIEIQSLKKTHPENLISLYLEDYSAFINIFLLENEVDYSSFLKQSEAIEKKLIKGDVASPYHLYCNSELLMHRAFAHFIFDDYWTGFWNLRKAYLLLLDNQKKFPGFIANEKNIAFINSLTGILPSNYYWLIKMFGLNPDLEGGMTQLRKLITVSNEHFFFREETILIYASLQFYTGLEKNDVISLFQNSRFIQNDNLLANLIYINILLHSHRNNECQKIISQTPQTDDYIKTPILKYYEGMVKLQQLKPESVNYFVSYIQSSKSKNLIKSACHKIAWSYLIQGNKNLYEQYIQKTLTNGKSVRESDKQAEKEANKNEIPDKEILKARLLFDGGYFEKSLSILNSINSSTLKNEKDIIELIYRKARVNDEMKNETVAIKLYKETITKGEKMPFYFAANAALQLGYIYERQNNVKEAKYYFNKCISLKEHEYVNSLSQKAKVALQRLN